MHAAGNWGPLAYWPSGTKLSSLQFEPCTCQQLFSGALAVPLFRCTHFEAAPDVHGQRRCECSCSKISLPNKLRHITRITPDEAHISLLMPRRALIGIVTLLSANECQHSLQIVATIYFAMILWLLSTAVDASKSTFSIQFKCLFLHLIYLNAFLFCLLLLMLHSLGPFTHDTLTAMPLSSCSRQKLCGRLDLHVFERHTLTT